MDCEAAERLDRRIGALSRHLQPAVERVPTAAKARPAARGAVGKVVC